MYLIKIHCPSQLVDVRSFTRIPERNRPIAEQNRPAHLFNKMYQPPTIFDFQRNLDTLIHTGQHQARAAAIHVKADHAARGLADSTMVITMAIGKLDEIHQDILTRAMQLIEDFCSRNAELSPGGTSGNGA
jgi:hypothetical protein